MRQINNSNSDFFEAKIRNPGLNRPAGLIAIRGIGPVRSL